jgi:hypothetical protein
MYSVVLLYSDQNYHKESIFSLERKQYYLFEVKRIAETESEIYCEYIMYHITSLLQKSKSILL